MAGREWAFMRRGQATARGAPREDQVVNRTALGATSLLTGWSLVRIRPGEPNLIFR